MKHKKCSICSGEFTNQKALDEITSKDSLEMFKHLKEEHTEIFNVFIEKIK